MGILLDERLKGQLREHAHVSAHTSWHALVITPAALAPAPAAAAALSSTRPVSASSRASWMEVSGSLCCMGFGQR